MEISNPSGVSLYETQSVEEEEEEVQSGTEKSTGVFYKGLICMLL